MANRAEKRFALPPDNDGNINYELALESKLPNANPFIVNLENRFEGYTYKAVVENSSLAPGKNHAVLINQSGSPYFIRIREVKIVPAISGNVSQLNATFNARAFSLANTTISGGTDLSSTNIRRMDLDFASINTTSPTIKLLTTPTSINPDGSQLYDGCIVTIEEGSIQAKEGIMLKHDTDASCLHLQDNLGIIIRQGGSGNVGVVNIFITFTVDVLPP